MEGRCSYCKEFVDNVSTHKKECFARPELIPTCPVCNCPKPAKNFTCSRACSNTFFRRGSYNGKHRAGKDNYQTICFLHHEKKCVICGEFNIVTVHHYDGNHQNNEPSNLIPLCPTHHQYYHSRYRDLVQPQIESYREMFLESQF